jgi:predicted restriction endonuclease
LRKKLYQCEVCGIRDKKLIDEHHIVPLSMGGGDDPDNLCNLCPNCHRKTHRGTVIIEGWLSLGYKYLLNWRLAGFGEAKPLAMN